MFAPSFFTGHLIKRFGVLNIIFYGALFGAACIVINLNGTSVNHFWFALFLLGVSWQSVNYIAIPAIIGILISLFWLYSVDKITHTQPNSEILGNTTNSVES
jgi:hypothetical protein